MAKKVVKKDVVKDIEVKEAEVVKPKFEKKDYVLKSDYEHYKKGETISLTIEGFKYLRKINKV